MNPPHISAEYAISAEFAPGDHPGRDRGGSEHVEIR